METKRINALAEFPNQSLASLFALRPYEALGETYQASASAKMEGPGDVSGLKKAISFYQTFP